MSRFLSTKVIELGSTAFRQPNAESHCKFVHGYRLKAKIWLSSETLDKNNWVFDFGGFKELKNILEKTFDHKLVIDKKDPAKTVFRELERYGAVDIVEMDGVGIEKFAEYIFNQTDNFVKFNTQNRVRCEKVEVFEHENNSAIYQRGLEVNAVISPKLETKEKQEVKEHIDLESLVTPTVQENKVQVPAPLHNKITTGWSNPFAGTSWGA
jgi:6-pyruvoyltetrahydropterin/6-carboxytetrahydropterin synthase